MRFAKSQFLKAALHQFYPSHPREDVLLAAESAWRASFGLRKVHFRHPKTLFSDAIEKSVLNIARGTQHPAWLLNEGQRKDRLMVLFHGWGSGVSTRSGHSMIDCAPRLLPYADVLIFDQAGCGQATGSYSFGHLEHTDAVAVLTSFEEGLGDYKQVTAIGFSAGCQVALGLYQETNYFDDCILDSMVRFDTFFDCPELFQRVFGIDHVAAPLTLDLMKLLLGDDVRLEREYRYKLGKDRVTMVFGGRDKYLKPSERAYLEAAIRPKTCIDIENAGHVRGLFEDQQTWLGSIAK